MGHVCEHEVAQPVKAKEKAKISEQIDDEEELAELDLVQRLRRRLNKQA